MEKHKYMYTLIESAMGNGIRYIEDNPQRGIRNLLDLGEYFASGRFQKSFFDIAHEMLNNENSFYYYKIGDLVRNTNHRTLANFGINLGYNSFTYGASKIREYEKNLNYKIPWTIVFDFRKENIEHLTKDEISNVLDKGKNVGIYCYIILLDSNNILLDLCPIIEDNDECAFSLILSYKIITEESIRDMKGLTNLCFFILLNDTDEIQLQNSVNYLRKEHILYGGCYYYDIDNFSLITDDDWISEKLNSIKANFTIMIQRPPYNAEVANKTYDYIYNSRFKTDSSAFIMDFYGDINRVGNIIYEIPKETHFLSIDSIGQISLTTLENKTKYNIRTNSFEEIFKSPI